LGVEWGRSADGWADVVIWVAFDTTGLPPGVLDVFVQKDSDWILIGQSYPNDGFCHEYVTQIWGEQYVYVARYRTELELGPMSAELVVDIQPPSP
jgi:hypothetical protein